MRTAARASLVVALTATGLALLAASGSDRNRAIAAVGPVTVTDYTTPSQDVEWGNRSHWAQPWRSYLDTVPAKTLLDAVGINFNVSPKVAPAAAKLLADGGFRRARIEVGWGNLDYEDPSRLTAADQKSLAALIGALRDNGIRPLILLNANHGEPCPVKRDVLHLTKPAVEGSTQIEIDPADVERVVPGHTGITHGGVAAAQLITSIEADGTAQMSQPLLTSYPEGELNVMTLRYEPFRAMTRPDGSPNPAFEPTMQGWLSYVGTVSREVESLLGSEEFDVEVWNELSFGSNFLYSKKYYEPDLESQNESPSKEILKRTVDYIRDPANGVPAIGVGNGFSNQRPWANGVESPVGLTAIDKHPYAGWESYPADAQVNGNRPLDGLGQLAGWKAGLGLWHETFTPSYEAFFPERPLSALFTETLVHDLSPYPSFVSNTEHGRHTRPPGGNPLQMWITEVNLGPGSGPISRAEMSPAEARHIETKNILRYLVAYVNKGVTAIHFFAATGAGDMSLIEPGFLSAAYKQPSVYPGDPAGGETIEAVGRLTDSMGGAAPLANPRSLTLRELTDFEGHVQFEGNGTAAYPSLYNRDVFAFLPFQVTDDRFVIPVYVMTRNVAEVYDDDAAAGDPTRFDLPPESYRMSIGGVKGSEATVSAFDPLTGASVPVEVVSRGAEEIVVAMGVTDSPRLLRIQEPGTVTPQGGKGAPTARRPKSKPRMQLRGGKKLLRSRRVKVFTECNAPCRLGVSGRISIAGRGFPMRVVGEEVSSSQQSMLATLSITAHVARLGRKAVAQRLPVKAVVTSRDLSGGGLETPRSTLVLSR